MMRYYYVLFGIAIWFGPLFANPRIQISINHCMVGYEKTKKLYLALVFSLVFLLIGLRGSSVGADTFGYIDYYFNGVLEGGVFFNKSPEIVLNILAWISQLFSKGHQLFFVLHAILVSCLFCKYILDNSCDVFLSTMIFLGMFFVPSMNLMREWLAIGFGVNALTALKNNKKSLVLVFLLLAFFTHLTAICLLAIVVFERIKNKKKAFWIIIVFFAAFFFLRNIILDYVISLVPRYYDYVHSALFVGEGGFNIKDLIFIVIELYYFFVLITCNNTDETLLASYYQNTAFLFIAIILSLSAQKIGIIHRLVYFYSVSLIISIPQMICARKIKTIIIIPLVIGMFVMLYRNSFWDNNRISHYLFFWQ